MSERIFTKQVENCDDCPNLFRDDEEHNDFCRLTFVYVGARGEIPKSCPLPLADA